MERLVINRKEELPYLVYKLRESSSPILRDWKKDFNPTLAYRTSINMRDVQIEFWGDVWENSYRLYHLFCEQVNWGLTVDNFIWLSLNTEIVNGGLLGNSQFNQLLKEKDLLKELDEFVYFHPLIKKRKGYLELYYTEKYVEMLQMLGMELVENKFMYRSNMGYYLPYDIKITYKNELDWVKDSGLFNIDELEVRHTPSVEIMCKKKGVFNQLAEGLYLKKGYTDLIVEWADKPLEEEYEVRIGSIKVKVIDQWKKDNKDYIKAVQKLESLSSKSLKAFRMKEIIRGSERTAYGIKLDEEYYNRLNIKDKKLVGGYTKIREGLYSTGDSELGKKVPIMIEFEGVSIQTPFWLIKEGEYYEPMIPIVRDDLYKENNKELATDIRVVLRYPFEEKKEDIEELMYKSYKEVEEDKVSDIHLYPSVHIKDEMIPETGYVEEKDEQKVLKGNIEDVNYIPYVDTIHLGGEEIRVYYGDGEILSIKGDGKRIDNLKERVLFRDRIGLDYIEGSDKVVNLLMSLGTDKLIYEGIESLEWISKEGLAELEVLIDKWLEVLNTGDVGGLKDKVGSFKDYLVEEEDDIDLFSEYDFFT